MKAAPGKGGAEAPTRTRLRVLIVEDSSDDALLILRELERGGYEPEHERVDTPEAMRRALAEREPWDVVLSDWRMPRFSATGALEMLREVGPEAPFIIVSGVVGEEAAVEAMRAGAHDYVMKDNLARLCATVEHGLADAEARGERRRAEKELRESEKRFRSLLEATNDVIWDVDLRTGELKWTGAVETMFGYSTDEVKAGTWWEDRLHPEDGERVISGIEGVMNGDDDVWSEEYRFRCGDGSYATVIDRAFVIRGEGGEAVRIIGSMMDVSERKQAEEEIRRLNENLEEQVAQRTEELEQTNENLRTEIAERERTEEERDRLFEFSLDLLCVAGLDGYFKRVNPAFEETLGYSSEELLAKPFIELVHPEDRAATISEMESLGRGVRAAYFENRYLRKDGSEVWLEWKSVPVVEEDLIYATARDVTGRKRAEEELRRREAILRAVAFAAECFLKRAASWEESTEEVLERLGRAAEVSRVYVFENYAGVDGEVWGTQRYEWAAEGVSAQMDNPLMQAIPYRAAGYGRWAEMLNRGEPLHGHTRNLPSGEQPELKEQNILSIVIVPIFVEEEWWGFIGFDECLVEREWPAAEIEALKAAADTLGAAIQRDRARRTLRESEERYRAVVEHATEGIFLLDAATGDILESNAALQELLGYTASELQSMRIHDLIADDQATIDSNMRLVLDEGSRFLGERRYRRKDGSLADVEASASVISYGERRVVCDVIRDITERKKNEKAIRQSEQLYRTVVEQATEYIYLVDVETRRIVGSNPTFREALGYTEEELEHLTLYDVVAHDRENIDRNARRVVEEGRRFLGERKYRRKDGSLIDVETSSSTILHDDREAFCVVGHDVTERKRAEEEIKRERDFSSAITDTVGALVGVFDSEGRIVRFNRACERLSGYTFEEVRGRYFWELFLLPEEVESVKDVAGEIKAGQFPNSNENYWRVRDGSLHLISWHNTALLDERGEVAYIIATGIDVTEQRRAEDELRESQRTLATLMSNLPGMAYRCRNDPDWTMELVSEGCLELTGYPPDDLIGNRRRSYGDLIYPEDSEAVWEDVQAAIGERLPFRLTYRITTALGETKWVWEQGRGVFSPEGELLALEGFITDATDRMQAFQMLEERVTALAGISASLTINRPMETTLNALAAGIVESTAAVACSVVLIDTETGLPRTAGSHGLPEGYTIGMQAAYRAGLRPVAMEVFRTRRPMLVRDVRRLALEQPLVSSVHRFLREAPWDTIYCVPLVSRGRALGTLNLYYVAGEEPGEDERVFLGAVADQAAVAVENARLFSAARGKAALEERQRLARELHDSVSQALYGIGLGSRTARTLLDREGPPERVAEWLEYVLSLAEAGLTEMRALIFELRPESLETEGLVTALEKQAAALRARHEIPVHTTLGEEPDLPLETKEALYRIAQEALHNTVKHARASRADLKLEGDARGVALEVSDDGAGFDPDEDFSGHLGLKSMRERAARLGATLRVESAPGEGASIRVRIQPSK